MYYFVDFYSDFFKMVLALVAIAMSLILLMVVLIYLKNQKKTHLKKECMVENIEDATVILDYKFLMCKEKFSNHSYVKSDENKDIYDKLSEGSIDINKYIVKNNYNIDSVFRGTYG